ncbi:hypothetical protein DPMN_020470 [Dreissena polymorpha]|uniref:Uncharacterized protein n=1 Tax=Dreissena polymorpha TaxID=45954 RepID=A0A9D4S891_DREPO|nr:hypothetical protein DPMN_020470 [Dreissena polymorpha]
MVEETAMSHSTATARLKLGNPRSLKCRPTNIRLLQWVLEAQCECTTSEWKPLIVFGLRCLLK